jgi:uncharacterized protein (TIGR03435 family)
MNTFLRRSVNSASSPQTNVPRLLAARCNMLGAYKSFLYLMIVSVGFLSASAYSQQSMKICTIAIQSNDGKSMPIAFDVVSIKPAKRNGWFSRFTEDGYEGAGVPVFTLVRAAFDQIGGPQITGVPQQIRIATYDIEAKVSSSDLAAYQKLSKHQRSLMLQSILVERFKLTCHHEMRRLPVYALVIAKGGPLLSPSEPGSVFTDGNIGDTSLDRHGMIHIIAQPLNMAAFARKISYQNDLEERLVIDKTGLTGYYRFDLFWSPRNEPLTAPTDTGAEPFGPSVYTALKEQLGLQLKPTTAMVDTLVIDHIEQPTPN